MADKKNEERSIFRASGRKDARASVIAVVIFAALVAIFGFGILALAHQYRWEIGYQVAGIAKMDSFPVNTAGYTIEQLPFQFTSSFARGHNVYFADAIGRVSRGDDRDPPSVIVQLGNSEVPARLLFVSSRGTIFVSGDSFPMVRSVDNGRTWEKSHDWSFWRMTEDEASHILYAGNYSPRNLPIYMAKVFKSADEGKTWQTIFEDDRLDHIHSILWDAKYNHLYISAGDTTRSRGQAYSQDNGATWHWINSGRKQGHTDLAISDNYVFWGSDDNLGRVIRAPRNPVQDGKTLVWQHYHHVWWVVAENRQIYAGTFTDGSTKSTGAFLLASDDEGETWQRLLADNDGGAAIGAFFAESRRLSADRWLYCTTISGKAYRIRRNFKGVTLAE